MSDGNVTVEELIDILSKYPKDLYVLYNTESYGLLGIYPNRIGIHQYMEDSDPEDYKKGVYHKFEDAVIITE